MQAPPPAPQLASEGGVSHVAPLQHPLVHVLEHPRHTPLEHVLVPQSAQALPPAPHTACDMPG
jgi:hypothetical protein